MKLQRHYYAYLLIACTLVVVAIVVLTAYLNYLNCTDKSMDTTNKTFEGGVILHECALTHACGYPRLHYDWIERYLAIKRSFSINDFLFKCDAKYGQPALLTFNEYHFGNDVTVDIDGYLEHIKSQAIKYHTLQILDITGRTVSPTALCDFIANTNIKYIVVKDNDEKRRYEECSKYAKLISYGDFITKQ